MSGVLTGLQQHLLDVHKNEAAGNLTMTQALSYHAQEHLSASGIRNHSEPRQLHRALAYRLAEIQGLEVPSDDIVNFLDRVLEGKIRGDHEDERASIEAVLNRHPESEVEQSRALRPDSQPLPVPRKDIPGAHDMVIADVHGIMARRQVALRNAGQTKEADAVRKLMNEIEADLKRRRALGLKRYGSLLQPGNGRDPLRDAYEEVVDLVAYFRQLIMARDEAVMLLVELLNDHAVGQDPVVRENVERVMYLLAGDDKKGSNDG